MTAPEPARLLGEPLPFPSVAFHDVDIRDELHTRLPRARDLAGEHRAFVALAAEMRTNPRNVLQRLAELALTLCDADTAGVSVLDGEQFQWEAVAGVFKHARGTTEPRGASPSRECLDQNAPQLMRLPDRCYPALYAKPRFVELLILPLRGDAAPFGTMWIVSHRVDRHFDRSDELIVAVLADLASAAWQMWKALETSRRQHEFLATLGHELRNPLAAMMTTTAVLLERVAEKSGPIRRACDVLNRQGRHLARLLDTLLDAGRVASGKLPIQAQRVDLVQLVRDVLETFRDVIEQRPLFLTVNFPDKPVWIDGDPVRLMQVFSNLIDNATKFTPPFGQIGVWSTVTERDVTICISDTGCGLRADQLEVIFEPFAQLSDGRGSRNRGLGLGLSLVRQIVARHNGTVEAQSAGPERGSRFAVRLPRRREDSSAPTG